MLGARGTAGVVLVQHALAQHRAAARPRHYHVVFQVEVHGEGQDGVGAKLRSALAETTPRLTLQTLEHLHALHVARTAASKGILGFGIRVDVAGEVVDETDDALQPLLFGQAGRREETHETSINLGTCYASRAQEEGGGGHLARVVVDEQRHLHDGAQLPAQTAQGVEHGEPAFYLAGTAREQRVEVARHPANLIIRSHFVLVPQHHLQRLRLQVLVVVHLQLEHLPQRVTPFAMLAVAARTSSHTGFRERIAVPDFLKYFLLSRTSTYASVLLWPVSITGRPFASRMCTVSVAGISAAAGATGQWAGAAAELSF